MFRKRTDDGAPGDQAPADDTVIAVDVLLEPQGGFCAVQVGSRGGAMRTYALRRGLWDTARWTAEELGVSYWEPSEDGRLITRGELPVEGHCSLCGEPTARVDGASIDRGLAIHLHDEPWSVVA